jgi:methionyl-tRNA synthetase
VDLGEGAPRQVVSGLVKHIPDAAQLAGRRVLVVANMKPANMRGVQSQAMVLAATGADGRLELVEPPPGAAVGERCAALLCWPGPGRARASARLPGRCGAAPPSCRRRRLPQASA